MGKPTQEGAQGALRLTLKSALRRATDEERTRDRSDGRGKRRFHGVRAGDAVATSTVNGVVVVIATLQAPETTEHQLGSKKE